MSAFRILHLSDIHIGDTYKPPKDIAYKIVSDLNHNGLCSIKSVIVTGDIFDGNSEISEDLFNDAITFFETLLKEINLTQKNMTLSKEDFIFVPGNHDLIRVDDKNERWSKYNTFLLKFFDSIPSNYNPKTFAVKKIYEDNKIAFLGFNSCGLEKKKVLDDKLIETFENSLDITKLSSLNLEKSELLNILRIDREEYYDFGFIEMEQLASFGRDAREISDYNIVALFHHHFDLFPEISQRFGDTSIIRNHAELKQHLSYMNVKTVLHGHKHFDLERPHITDDYYNTAENIVHVFAGGSIGTNRSTRHTFSVIDFYDKQNDIQIIQNKFVYNGELLEPIEKKQIPPQKLIGSNIKLLELLAAIEPTAKRTFEETIIKIHRTFYTFEQISVWVGKALSGFDEISKILHQDYKNLLFLLYAINFRVLEYKKNVDKEKAFSGFDEILKKYFNEHIMSDDLGFIGKDYHTLFEKKKLDDVAKTCDYFLKKCSNKKSQMYLAFSMVGIFFTDLYLVLTEYADDFKESIKYKVNISIEENKFHENVPSPRISLQSVADRRSVYVEMLCNDPTAHKIAVLFVKEFDIFINQFEDYFKIIGLKLYYLLPKIDKSGDSNPLDNYNFEAYIPTLLPLLTGDNIYPKKVVFARELIQNSIDAIAVRKAKDTEAFSTKIDIHIGKDDAGRRCFIIRDNGTGMDRHKVERYFTSIGRSFYTGDEFDDLNISYKPISSFGIGFLSSFMICKEIDVKTKYYLADSEPLKLQIPNYDGCFFIERDNEDMDVGTKLKLYLNKDIENKSIAEYIRNVFLDVKYDIDINYLDGKNNRNIFINAHQIRKDAQSSNYKFFVPFTDKFEILSIDYEKEVLSNEFITKYEYGMFIAESIEGEKKDLKPNHMILNSGILVERSSFDSLIDDDIFYKSSDIMYVLKDEYKYDFKSVINFPSNWIQPDVSREKLTGFTKDATDVFTENANKSIGNQIANALFKQIKTYKKHVRENRSALSINHLNQVADLAINLCKKHETKEINEKLKQVKYKLIVKSTIGGITFEMSENFQSEDEFENVCATIRQGRVANQLMNKLDKEDDEKIETISSYVSSMLFGNYRRETIDRRIHWEGLIYDFLFVEKKGLKHSNLRELRELRASSKDKPQLTYSEEEGLHFFLISALFIIAVSAETEERIKILNGNTKKSFKRDRALFELNKVIEDYALNYFKISDVENGKNKVEVKSEDILGYFLA